MTLAVVDGLPFGPEALIGPFALLVAALIAVAVLWREDRRVYRERIDDLKAQRDYAAAGWKTATEALAKLAARERRRRNEDDS